MCFSFEICCSRKRKEKKKVCLLQMYNYSEDHTDYLSSLVSKVYPDKHYFVLQRVDTFERGHRNFIFSYYT